jgi:hypothetical protein
VRNETDREQTIESSDVLTLNFPNQPHKLSFVERVFTWREMTVGLSRGGRNGIVRYDSGDGGSATPKTTGPLR